MIISEGLNDDAYFNEAKYINVGNDVTVVVDKIIEIEDKVIEIIFMCIDGPQEGATHKERYWLTLPEKDESGKILKHGGIWRVRLLMIACGLYDTTDDDRKVVREPIDTKQFIGKKLLADFIKRESKNGKSYTNIINVREIDFNSGLSPKEVV